MKNWKKIAALFALVLLVFSSWFSFAPKASAATIDPNQITYQGVTYQPIGARPTTLYGNTASAKTCYGGSVVVFDSNTGEGTVYKVTTTIDLAASLKTAAPQVASFLSGAPNGDCFIQGVGGTAITVDNKGVGQTKVDAPDSAKGQACFQNSTGSPLTWLLCPILDAASGMTNALVRLFEDQLSFNVSQLGNVKDQTSGAFKTYKAWSFIRIIASILLVIVILVMVISQAIGSGPFDAYTVRKLLPKLIIAVILMQISWTVFAWVVNVVDDIGKGLADLMFAPFGGASNLDLWHLLANAKLSSGLLGALDWGGVIGLAFLGVAFPFTMLGVALMAVLAILAGLMTLIFRKILIIMALVISPLALVMWILPGTDRYWKLWKDNFTKALLMFPLAVLIITSGRIFAYIAGTQDNSQFLNLIFILAGFFLPLFILPKTYQWGGTAMKLAGDAAMKASSKIGERPKKLMDSRQEEWKAERTRQSAERVARGEGFNRRAPWRYPIDKFKSGDWDPTRGIIPKGALGNRLNPEGSRRRQRAHDTYVETGQKSHQEDVNAAEARLIRERQEHRARGGDHDLLLQAIADGLETYEDPKLGRKQVGRRNSVEKMAARKQLAKLGAGMNWRYLEDYYERSRRAGGEQAAEMRRFFDDNVETILPKMPHIYKSVGQAADADPGGIAQMHGVEIESILSNLSNEIKTGQTFDDAKGQMRQLSPEDIKGRQTSLTTFLQNFQRAVEGSQRGGPQLENGALRAAKAFLDKDASAVQPLLETINDDRFHGRRAPERGSVLPGEPDRELIPLPRVDEIEVQLDPEHRARMETLRDSLAGMIDPDGIVKSTPPLTAAVAPQTQQTPYSPAGGYIYRPSTGTSTPTEGGINIDHGAPPSPPPNPSG